MKNVNISYEKIICLNKMVIGGSDVICGSGVKVIVYSILNFFIVIWLL